MLPSASLREVLLACPLLLPWNMFSFTVEFTLSSRYSRSYPPFSRQDDALVHLDSLPHYLVIWTDSSFPFCKGRSGVLANCSLFRTEATLFFSAGPVCSSVSAEACAILHALCWSRQHNKSGTSHPFSSTLTLVLFSSPCLLLYPSFSFNLSGRSVRNCLLSFSDLSGYNGSPDTGFSRETTLMSWPDVERYSCSLQSIVAFVVSSLVSTFVFSRTGGIFSSKLFPRLPPRSLCSLVTLAVLSFAYVATDTALR